MDVLINIDRVKWLEGLRVIYQWKQEITAGGPMDDIDRAQQFQADELRRALDKIPRGGVSATHCEQCGEEIPEKRRKAAAGCRFCVACQKGFERRTR